MDINQALSKKRLIEEDAIKRIWLFICKKYPNDSTQELEAVFQHALHSAIDKYMIDIFDESIYDRVLKQLSSDLFDAPKKGLSAEVILNCTLYTSCKMQGEVSKPLQETCFKWLADTLEPSLLEAGVSIKDKKTFESKIRMHIADQVEGVKKSIADQRTRQALMIHNQLYRLKLSTANGGMSEALEEVEGLKGTDYTDKILLTMKHAFTNRFTDFQLEINEVGIKAHIIEGLKSVYKEAIEYLSSLAFKVKSLNVYKVRRLAGLSFLILVSIHLAGQANERMEFAGTRVNITDSEAYSIQAIIWEVASLEDHMHYMAIKKEKNLLETNGRYNPFPYTPVNWAGVRAYLKSYNSMLAESPYFEIVIDVGMEKNVDPRLLFSIVGQEQSFVRKGSVSARRIINNPYNVYVSWKDYNTNLRDSTEIAANTIRNIMAEAPFELHPVEALNQVYAEDPRWWIGVDYFYSEMVELGEI